MLENATHAWYADVLRYTKQLVHMQSISPGTGEISVAQTILELLHEGGLQERYTLSGLDALAGDRYGRHNAYAFLKGRSRSTLVLLSHFDIVGTKDYGSLEAFSLVPDALTERRAQLGAVLAGTDPDDWMFGRGTADMKSGVAVNIALIRHFAARSTQLPLSLLFLTTPDEENESAGVLQAVHFLSHLRAHYDIEYVGAINTDYTTAQYTGDTHRYIFNGTIGKLLPSFLCIGSESHVGTSFNGLDANLLAAELIRDVSMNDALCDSKDGQVTAPPVTLRAADLKTHYDVQLPFAAYFYLNVLTLTTTPDALLTRLHRYATTALAAVLQRVDEAEARWRRASGTQAGLPRTRTGVVLTYADLYTETVRRLGEQRVRAELDAEWEQWGPTVDSRERSLRLVHKLWTISEQQGPAIVLYYSPPYYPHVAATTGALHDALTAVVQAHPELPLVQQACYPYLSDLSYLRLDANVDTAIMKTNMPVWKEQGGAGSYYLPLAAIAKLNIPVVNFGPFGQGAHQRNEGVVMSYSFGALPQLICETIEYLGEHV